MDELDKVLAVSLGGQERERELREFRKILDGWNMVMPPADPAVEDFGLGEFRKIGLIECWIANEAAAGYCGKFLFVFDGQTCPAHSHRSKHETFCVLRGTVVMTLDGATRPMGPGDVLPIEPGHVHSFTGRGPALLLEVSKPCVLDDNFFADTRIPIGGNFRGR